MSKNFSSSLRHKITIQNLILDENEQEIWQDFVNVRAEVKAMYDSKLHGETFIAMQMIDSSFYRFRIRFIKYLKTNMRIIYNNRFFYIKRIINQDELNLVSIIIAQENL